MSTGRCPVCGAEDTACGHRSGSATRPVDIPTQVITLKGDGMPLVPVEVRPGVWLKLTEKEAEAYRKEAEQAANKERKQAETEDKSLMTSKRAKGEEQP